MSGVYAMPDDMDGIRRAVEDTLKAATETQKAVAILETRFQAVAERVDRHEKILDGNGSKGLVTKVSHVQRTADENSRKIDTMPVPKSDTDVRWKAIGHIAVALVAATSLAMHLLGG